MAQKYLLIPEPIYRGLTSSAETGDLNLDYTKKELDKIKHGRIESSRKNILYNQELRRYLQLRNERENRPARVEITNGLRMLVKKGDELEDDGADEIIIDGDEGPPKPPNPPKPPKPPRRKENKRGKNGNERAGTNQDIMHDAEINRDDIFIENRDEDGRSVGSQQQQHSTIQRGTKRKADDFPINFTPKRWPLPVPEPAFRESAKKKYFKAKYKKSSPPTFKKEDDDEFGNSPPPSPPLELIESMQKTKRIQREQDPGVIEITSAGIRAERKRSIPFEEEIESKKKQKMTIMKRPIPVSSKNREREKQILRRSWATRKPTAEEAGAEKVPREKAIPWATRKPTKFDLGIRWANTKPTRTDMEGELVNVVTNKVMADMKRRRPIQVYEEVLPKKKVKPEPPPKPLPAIMPPVPSSSSLHPSNKKPLSSRFKWATRQPTKEEAANIGSKRKINWAIRKPSREEDRMPPKINWATRKPTQNDIGKRKI